MCLVEQLDRRRLHKFSQSLLITNNTGAQTRRGPLREINGGAAPSRCGAGRKDKHVGILEHEGDTSEQGVSEGARAAVARKCLAQSERARVRN